MKSIQVKNGEFNEEKFQDVKIYIDLKENNPIRNTRK